MPTKLENFHSRAMELASKADIVFANKFAIPRALGLYRKAFELEKKAAVMLGDRHRMEPTRSILYRSAASLALQIGERDEAERLIFAALAGKPPTELGEELRLLWDQCNFERHLPVDRFKLAPQEFLISFYGNAVGPGFAPCDKVVNKIDNTEKLMYRTAERLAGRTYREHGGPPKDIQGNFGVYMSVPKAAASITFAIRIGGTDEQLRMFGETSPSGVVNEMMTCVEMLGESKYDQLESKIANDDYYTNFIGLARQISGRADDNMSVAFASVEGTNVRRVAVHLPSPPPIPPTALLTPSQNDQLSIVGELKYADSTKQKRGIIEITSGTEKHTIRVPKGLMSDVVRPYFEKRVKISCNRRNDGKLWLENISEDTP